MPFQKVEYEFPDGDQKDEEGGLDIELEPSSAVPMGETRKDKDEDADEDEVELEVIDDTPENDRGRKPSDPPEDVTDEELQDYSEKVQNRIKHFSKGYHDERRAKEAAMRERQELEAYAKKLVEENQNLKGTVGQNQQTMLEQAKRSVAGELAAAKQAYREAYEAGDTDAVIDAQEQLTTARLREEKLNSLQIPPLQANETPVKMSPEERQPADQKAAAWAKANPWFGTDDEMTGVALGYHSKLASQGVDLQSEEYYDAINARMRKVFPENFEDVEPEAGTRKRTTNVVAPATRSTAPRKVRLTQTQVAIAKRLGVPLELYAKQVADDMRKQNG